LALIHRGCPEIWPPPFRSGKASSGHRREPQSLTSVRRTRPAGAQVVYNGHPLYFDEEDKKSGDTLGQSFAKLWYVVSPKGTRIKKDDRGDDLARSDRGGR
jgi:predicted lipoprotein with Yx(FWY)xxD motif